MIPRENIKGATVLQTVAQIIEIIKDYNRLVWTLGRLFSFASRYLTNGITQGISSTSNCCKNNRKTEKNFNCHHSKFPSFNHLYLLFQKTLYVNRGFSPSEKRATAYRT